MEWRREWQLTPVFLSGKFHGQTTGSQRVGHNWETIKCRAPLRVTRTPQTAFHFISRRRLHTLPWVTWPPDSTLQYPGFYFHGAQFRQAPTAPLEDPGIHSRGAYNRGWQEVFSLLLLRTDSKLSPQSFICRIRPRKPRTNYSHREDGSRHTLPAPSWTLARSLCARARTRSPATGPGGWQKIGREGGGWDPSWLALPARFLTSVNGSIAPDFGQNGGSNSEKEKWVPAQCVTGRKQEGGGELSQAPLLFPTASEVRLGLQRRFKFEFQRPHPRACARARQGEGHASPGPGARSRGLAGAGRFPRVALPA